MKQDFLGRGVGASVGVEAKIKLGTVVTGFAPRGGQGLQQEFGADQGQAQLFVEHPRRVAKIGLIALDGV